ncbi:hypothetical protein RRG08_035588 [Elysia crispata]|uniref:Uncharacterized protein n=1 Tax=Elysia crispata TaxID=231223 RepID=A0AAE1B510_9GAST|nr:hypothetical protein RRG08_035588 [Elysia crispata]
MPDSFQGQVSGNKDTPLKTMASVKSRGDKKIVRETSHINKQKKMLKTMMLTVGIVIDHILFIAPGRLQLAVLF